MVEKLKVNADTELSFVDRRPRMILKSIKVWDIPVLKASLGNLENVDLMREPGDYKSL